MPVSRMFFVSNVFSYFTGNDRITSPTSISAPFYHHHQFVVEQEPSNWDEVSSSYLTSWISLSPSTINKMPCVFECDHNQDLLLDQNHCFCLIWAQYKTASERICSIDSLNCDGDVLGFMTVPVPIVVFVRVHYAIEVG